MNKKRKSNLEGRQSTHTHTVHTHTHTHTHTQTQTQTHTYTHTKFFETSIIDSLIMIALLILFLL